MRSSVGRQNYAWHDTAHLRNSYHLCREVVPQKERYVTCYSWSRTSNQHVPLC